MAFIALAPLFAGVGFAEVVAVSAVATGAILAKEHTKNKRPSNRPKHEKGDARRQADKRRAEERKEEAQRKKRRRDNKCCGHIPCHCEQKLEITFFYHNLAHRGENCDDSRDIVRCYDDITINSVEPIRYTVEYSNPTGVKQEHYASERRCSHLTFVDGAGVHQSLLLVDNDECAHLATEFRFSRGRWELTEVRDV
eukprot:TRINITY_DN76670_c0_g1_i1.p1 TRINITY_DN76670_c0_g1~~TRINITY_DN76670_c0_g1_i1.p1  ORF type:complete len:217 (-),score=21.23 TRINITY_DN76670_c0_g1_i1:99-686(-)